MDQPTQLCCVLLLALCLCLDAEGPEMTFNLSDSVLLIREYHIVIEVKGNVTRSVSQRPESRVYLTSVIIEVVF